MDQPNEEHVDETPLKPKRTRKVTEEQKIILAERMRKVNEDRISKAREIHEKEKITKILVLDGKEKQAKEKLERIETKRESLKPKAVSIETPVAPVAPVKEKKIRKVYVEQSESESEEEIVYVTKPKVVKPKAPVKAPVAQETKVIFKFI